MMHSPSTSGSTVDRAAIRRAAWGSFIGSVIEWYDFFLFGAASALVFGPLFFPGSDPFTGMLASFAVFGTGFLARPFGAFFFGFIGDRIGRKKTLVVTLLSMGISTFLVGCLPTADQIGVMAPILLVVMRLIQGFATGGEWGGATLVAIEFAPDGKRGKYGTFPQLGNGVGITLSNAIFAMMTLLPEDAFMSWGWRLPFFLSAILVVVGFIIRRRVSETPSFVKLAAANRVVKNPIGKLFKHDTPTVIKVICMKLVEGVFAIIIFTFVVGHATGELGVDRTEVLVGSTAAAALSVLTQYFYGSLSDKIGRKKVFMFGTISVIIFAFPFFLLVETANPVWIGVALVVGYAVCQSAYYSVHTSYFAELFPPTTRYSAIAVSTNIGSVLSSGPSSLIAGSLVALAGGSSWMVGFYVVIVAIISSVALLLSPETAGKPLRGEDDATEAVRASA